MSWSRDDAFEMLDESVAAYQGYQWLQRLSVTAPLVGVLITAWGLNTLKPPSESAVTIASILNSISPLFQGVMVGASLAIANQLFLQVVQREIEDLRRSARSWFDRVVWAQKGAPVREAAGATVAALDALAASIRDSIKLQSRGAIRMRKATMSVGRAGLASERAFQGFGAGLAEFSAQLGSLKEAAESARLMARSMEPSLREAHDALAGSVGAFREAILSGFVPAAEAHGAAARAGQASSETTQAILGRVEEFARGLREQAGLLASTTRDLGQSGVALKESIASGLAPAQASLRTAAGALDQAARAIPGQFEQATAAFSSTAEKLRATLDGDLAPAVALLRKSIEDDLSPSIRRQGDLAQEATRVSHGLSSLFDQILGASKSLEERYERLARASEEQALASRKIHESVRENLIPAQRAIAGAAAELGESSEGLSRFIEQGIGPATGKLAELGQVIAPMREAAGAIGALGDLKGEIRDLSGIVLGLRQAVESAKVLAELETTLGQLSASFAKAGELRETVAEIPVLFAHQLNEMSRQALRGQADELRETLADIAKQFGLVSIDHDGQREPRP